MTASPSVRRRRQGALESGPTEKARRVTVSGPSRLKADNMQMLLAAALDGGGIVYGPTFCFGSISRVADWNRFCLISATESFGYLALLPKFSHVGYEGALLHRHT